MEKSEPRCIDGTSVPLAPLITGAHYPANAGGFLRMLAEANIVEKQGWQLITLVRLEGSVAVAYRRTGKSIPTKFFEEEDGDL